MVFGLVMVFILVVSLNELYQIFSLNDLHTSRAFFFSIPILIYLSAFLVIISVLPLNFLIITILLAFLSMLIPPFLKLEKPAQQAGAFLLSVFYLVIPLLALSLLYFSEKVMESPRGFLLFSVFAITWLNDTFAYMTGSIAGKHKLAVHISPNKTWEGSLGGLLFSLAGAYVLFLIFGQISLFQWFGLAVITVVFGSLGDLFESLLKRSAGIKESGKLIPGHGGILDRFDSVLIAAPFVYLYLYFILL